MARAGAHCRSSGLCGGTLPRSWLQAVPRACRLRRPTEPETSPDPTSPLGAAGPLFARVAPVRSLGVGGRRGVGGSLWPSGRKRGTLEATSRCEPSIAACAQPPTVTRLRRKSPLWSGGPAGSGAGRWSAPGLADFLPSSALGSRLPPAVLPRPRSAH